MAKRDNEYSMVYELDDARGVVKGTLRLKDPDSGEFEAVETVEFALSEVPDALKTKINLYGLSKFVQDRASDTEVGPDKIPAMTEVYNNLRNGQWEKARVVGSPTVSPEVEALAEIKGITIPDAQKALRAYSKEQRETILKNPKIVERAAAIRERRATAEAVSLDDLAA